MRRSQQQHATRIFDRGSRAAQLASMADKARVTLSRSAPPTEAMSRNKFYSNRRRATLSFEFCVVRFFT
jgi:hypothetical protein